MSKKRTIALSIIGIFLLISLVIGISYALWRVNLSQTTANTLASDCFNITFTEGEAIELLNTYPMYDEDGSKLTPYTFTIKNNCASYATYQINLEILNNSTLNDQYLKVMLDEKSPKLLTNYQEGEITLDEAKASYVLENDALDHNEEKTYNLRVWLDENVTLETEGVQNSTWSAKVTITAKYSDHLPTDYEKCVEKYGEDSINCNIIAQLDDTGACPEVNDDGTVKIIEKEDSNGYVCSAPDDYGTSYYFRGIPENNWVKFANAYWRIIRINGDDSIRMIYNGDASVIDALPNKEEVLKNGYDDSSTDYTQIGTSAYNNYWKKDNVQETVNSRVDYDNAGVGYMYGNRDGIVTLSSDGYNSSAYFPKKDTYYFADSYNYDASTGRFSLVDPVGILGSEATEENVVGKYTCRSTSATGNCDMLSQVTSIQMGSSSDSNHRIYIKYVIYGTTSKEKAQTNTNDSIIKEYIDEWYESHIKGTEYEPYVSDSLFCNDRSLYHTIPSGYSNLGYGVEKTAYRAFASSQTTLACKQKNDRFTVDDETIGNGDLTYPIALINTDEFYLAGGYTLTSVHYLNNGNFYLTMSPRNTAGSMVSVSTVSSNGSTSQGFVSSSSSVRPVINLKPNSLKQGDGSASNPYRIAD